MQFTGSSKDFNPGEIDFTSFEKSPDKAILLWLLNSGLDVSEWISRLPDELAKRKIQEEIKSHVLSPDELATLTTRFHEAQGLNAVDSLVKDKPDSVNAHMMSCSTCGIRELCNDTNVYREVALQEIASLLVVKEGRLAKYKRLKNASPIEIPLDKKYTMKQVELHKIMSIYHSPVDLLQ